MKNIKKTRAHGPIADLVEEASQFRRAALSADLGLEQTLRDVGIGESDLSVMAADAMKQTRLLVNNPRDVSEVDALAIYQAAF